MINMVGVAYELPPPPAPPDIPAVVAAMPHKNLYGNRGRDKDGSSKKRRSVYDELFIAFPVDNKSSVNFTIYVFPVQFSIV